VNLQGSASTPSTIRQPKKQLQLWKLALFSQDLIEIKPPLQGRILYVMPGRHVAVDQQHTMVSGKLYALAVHL
jgi:hypothetical protein